MEYQTGPRYKVCWMLPFTIKKLLLLLLRIWPYPSPLCPFFAGVPFGPGDYCSCQTWTIAQSSLQGWWSALPSNDNCTWRHCTNKFSTFSWSWQLSSWVSKAYLKFIHFINLYLKLMVSNRPSIGSKMGHPGKEFFFWFGCRKFSSMCLHWALSVVNPCEYKKCKCVY